MWKCYVYVIVTQVKNLDSKFSLLPFTYSSKTPILPSIHVIILVINDITINHSSVQLFHSWFIRLSVHSLSKSQDAASSSDNNERPRSRNMLYCHLETTYRRNKAKTEVGIAPIDALRPFASIVFEDVTLCVCSAKSENIIEHRTFILLKLIKVQNSKHTSACSFFLPPLTQFSLPS